MSAAGVRAPTPRPCSGRSAVSKWARRPSLGGGSWRLLPGDRYASWPFDGPLQDLLNGGEEVVVATTRREFYRYLQPSVPQSGPWSKRRQADRLEWMPRLLAWADEVGVAFERGVLHRVEEGFSARGQR